MNVRRTALRIAAVVVVLTVMSGVQTALTAAPSPPSSVVVVDPARILDTRTPLGVPVRAPLGPNSSITLQVGGVGGVPADAVGVILTLTAVGATVPTFISATPTGTPRSETSVLNPVGPNAIANTITVALGSGRLDLYNLAGQVDLIADVSGYLLPSPGTGRIVSRAIEVTAYGGSTTLTGAVDNVGCVDLADAGQIFLDIPLPHGAAVQEVVFRWFDNDVANFTMFLTEIDGGGFTPLTGGNVVGGQTQSTGALGFGSSTATISGGDAVSATVRYALVAFTLGQSAINGSHRFCGATVRYLINDSQA